MRGGRGMPWANGGKAFPSLGCRSTQSASRRLSIYWHRINILFSGRYLFSWRCLLAAIQVDGTLIATQYSTEICSVMAVARVGFIGARVERESRRR